MPSLIFLAFQYLEESLKYHTQLPSYLVIGGGISGLIAATILQSNGFSVTVLDKGRGIGGRLATRRIRSATGGEGIFDYGVQYFQVQTRRVQSWIDTWIQQGLVETGAPRFLGVDHLAQNLFPYYRGTCSNRSIAQSLAESLTVHANTRITRLQWHDPDWLVYAENNTCFQGNVIVLTPPLPQTLGLLNISGIVISEQARQDLERVTYSQCIAVLALLATHSHVPVPGDVGLEGQPLSWLGCNTQKGISPNGHAVTLLASSEFSEAHWEVDNSIVANQLIAAAQPWIGSLVIDYNVHRWRYRQPLNPYRKTFLALSTPGPVVLAGDAFGLGGVEGAILSGLEAADYLLEIVT